MRNFHIPHGYLDSLAMHHDNYHYDSYGSEGVVLRSRRKRYYRNRPSSDYSDSRHDYKWQCKCSCAKCNNPKPCCMEFCSLQCGIPGNILVVPYPVPYMVQPMSNQTTTSSTTTGSTTPSTTTTPTTKPTTAETTPSTRQTLPETRSTVAFYVTKGNYKRFRILPEKKIRRNMGGNIHRPNEFTLPKYGIVPIPENLAMKLMHQIRNDQKNDQFRKRLNQNLLDYGD